jgi:histidinol-phosphatase
MTLADDLALAQELADAADVITMARFRATDLRVETKPDMSPVSEADRAVESDMRSRIAEARPGDGVLGEEEGDHVSSSERRWILDPIDGTRAYVRGLPVFASLIALQVDGRIDLGIVSAPGLRRRWWAARGLGAFANGLPIHVSAVTSVADAFISTGDLAHFDSARRAAYMALAAQSWNGRALGDFWSHMLVAEGTIDIAVEPLGAVWDYAALQPIVEEAGGRFTDFEGVARFDGTTAISTNGLLHDAVVGALRG